MDLFGLFKGKKTKPEKPSGNQDADRGILVFDNTSEVIRAEKILKGKDWEIHVMGPPPEIRSGCDLVIVFPLIEELNILRILQQAGVSPLNVVPLSSPLLKPVDLYQIKDYGEYLMVRAANMKITIEKSNHKIVNISGGGCPDAPYLAHEMTGETLNTAPSPRDLGHTLCAYALHLAFEEMTRLCLP